MSNYYSPDNWVIIKMDDGNDPHYRVLAGWSGGYWKAAERFSFPKRKLAIF